MNSSRIFRAVPAFFAAVAVLCGLVSGGGVASALPQQGNPNPIDWTIDATIIGRGGEDLPLRNGQHDYGEVDGFGLFHIQDGHGGFIPDYGEIQAAAEKCTSNSNPNASTVCDTKDSDGKRFVVVWTERVDSRTPDQRPVGIITAYYP